METPKEPVRKVIPDVQVLPIYIITVIQPVTQVGKIDSRSWGWYPDLTTCQQVILENQTDIFEDGYYRWAVVERVPYGVMPEITESWWFEAVYKTKDAEPGRVIRDPEVRGIEKPSQFEMVAGFSLG